MLRPPLAATAPAAIRAGRTTLVTPPHVTARANVTLPGLRWDSTQLWTCSSTPGTADPCPATQMVSRANVRPAAAEMIAAVAGDNAGVTRGGSPVTADSPAASCRGPVTFAPAAAAPGNSLTNGRMMSLRFMAPCRRKPGIEVSGQSWHLGAGARALARGDRQNDRRQADSSMGRHARALIGTTAWARRTPGAEMLIWWGPWVQVIVDGARSGEA